MSGGNPDASQKVTHNCFTSGNTSLRSKHGPMKTQGWISDVGIDGPTFVRKGGYFLLILIKVCPQKLAFS